MTEPRSNSTVLPGGPVPMEDSAVPVIAGALFHVIPVSVQVLFVMRKIDPPLVPPSLASRRRRAELGAPVNPVTVNLRYERNWPLRTLSVVKVPKFFLGLFDLISASATGRNEIAEAE